jgi:hypothetical protein
VVEQVRLISAALSVEDRANLLIQLWQRR